MKVLIVILSFSLQSLLFGQDGQWLKKAHSAYDINYTAPDKMNIDAYATLVDNSIRAVEQFFNAPLRNRFQVFIQPNRNSLDSTWKTEWNIPDLKSECWMVASGIAQRLDMISPAQWDKEACEHKYADSTETQRLITHEIFHVFHAQLNASPDFSEAENMDWFVEGLATYASGQLDSVRILNIEKNILSNSIPASLDSFWTGKSKYGLSGSVVMYIDKVYGRDKLKQLLPLSKKQEVLDFLKITEGDLLSQWKLKMIADKKN